MADYKTADAAGKNKILEKLVQGGMQCLDWANELSKSNETETKETNNTVKGFFTRSLGCIIL